MGIVSLIFFPPILVLMRYASPKHEVVFGGSALTIKTRREQKSVAYAEIGSMLLGKFITRRLELYDHAGQLLHCFRTGDDEETLSSIVHLITERIAFDAHDERRGVRYIRR
jgi:hypothetical protein